MEKVGLLIDLGNSETRVCLVRKGIEKDFTLSNKVVKLDTDYKIPTEYCNEKTTVFKYNDCLFANGSIVEREFASKAIAPSSQQTKTEQLPTYTSLSLVFIKAYEMIAAETGVSFEDVDVSFDLRLLLPPSEHDKYSETLKSSVKTIKMVEVVSPICATKKVKINSLVVLPEGATAFIGCMYQSENGEMTINKANEKFQQGTVLVVDIGAGTTDIVLIKDTEVVVDSKETCQKGGNNVEALCKRRLYKTFDYWPSAQAMQRVLTEGILEKGNETFDVVEHLNYAKESFGAELKNFIIDYLSRNDVQIRDVKGLLVLGGGTLPTVRDGVVVSPSMSEVLTNYIHELTNSIALMDIGGLNPRMLNMAGLKIYYKFT